MSECKKPLKNSITASFSSNKGVKYTKAKEWKVPTVSVQWLNDVLFNSNLNAEQNMHNPKYQDFKAENPLRVDYGLVPHLMTAWKTPIRVTPVSFPILNPVNKFCENVHLEYFKIYLALRST